jgi:secondary thiamine-phosphate synthase enzyme
MRQVVTMIEIATRGQGLLDITAEIAGWADAQRLREGLLTLFCRHTSASLLVQENAAPDARADLEAYFARLTRRILLSTPIPTKARTTCRRTCAPR